MFIIRLVLSDQDQSVQISIAAVKSLLPSAMQEGDEGFISESLTQHAVPLHRGRL